PPCRFTRLAALVGGGSWGLRGGATFGGADRFLFRWGSRRRSFRGLLLSSVWSFPGSPPPAVLRGVHPAVSHEPLAGPLVVRGDHGTAVAGVGGLVGNPQGIRL